MAENGRTIGIRRVLGETYAATVKAARDAEGKPGFRSADAQRRAMQIIFRTTGTVFDALNVDDIPAARFYETEKEGILTEGEVVRKIMGRYIKLGRGLRTQVELANEINVSSGTISGIENGKNLIPKRVVNDLRVALGWDEQSGEWQYLHDHRDILVSRGAITRRRRIPQEPS